MWRRRAYFLVIKAIVWTLFAKIIILNSFIKLPRVFKFVDEIVFYIYSCSTNSKMKYNSWNSREIVHLDRQCGHDYRLHENVVTFDVFIHILLSLVKQFSSTGICMLYNYVLSQLRLGAGKESSRISQRLRNSLIKNVICWGIRSRNMYVLKLKNKKNRHNTRRGSWLFLSFSFTGYHWYDLKPESMGFDCHSIEW